MTDVKDGRLPNEQYAQRNEVFRRACQLAGVKPTRRQASKYRRGQGRAVAYINQAREELNNGKAAE